MKKYLDKSSEKEGVEFIEIKISSNKTFHYYIPEFTNILFEKLLKCIKNKSRSNSYENSL
jgi:hypothetical protein